jgi:hypothetical protein
MSYPPVDVFDCARLAAREIVAACRGVYARATQQRSGSGKRRRDGVLDHVAEVRDVTRDHALIQSGPSRDLRGIEPRRPQRDDVGIPVERSALRFVSGGGLSWRLLS